MPAAAALAASSACTSGGTLKAIASHESNKASIESNAFAPCLAARSAAASGRRAHTPASCVLALPASMGAWASPAHAPAPTSPTTTGEAIPRPYFHAGTTHDDCTTTGLVTPSVVGQRAGRHQSASKGSRTRRRRPPSAPRTTDSKPCPKVSAAATAATNCETGETFDLRDRVLEVAIGSPGSMAESSPAR